MDIEKDFEELLQLFNAHNVKYCVVGAFAVAFHSIPRYTKDMDLFVEPSKQNAENILRALKAFGFESLQLTTEDFSQPGQTIQLGQEPVRIDLLTEVTGCSFEDVWKTKESGIYGDTKTFFINFEELIKNKRQTGRKKDEVDVEQLLKIQQKKKK